MTNNNPSTSNHSNLTESLEKMRSLIWEIAENCQGNSQDLLLLLRNLEESHRKIRTELFETSLPNNRQALYHLLKDIEDEGGWPYIERMRIKHFLQYLMHDNSQDISDDRSIDAEN